MDGFKKGYHNACKEEKTATSRENSSKLDNNNPEAQRKLQEKVEKCQQEVHKVCVCEVSFIWLLSAATVVSLRLLHVNELSYDWLISFRLVADSICMTAFQTKERYEKSLEELDKVTPQYMENMEQVFEQWQQFEDKRLSFFKELLLSVKQHLDLSNNHK